MLYLLDRNEEVIGVFDNNTPFACPYLEDFHIENVETGVNTYEFVVPGSHETAAKIPEDGFIIFADLDSRFQMFQIKDIAEEAGEGSHTKKVYCEHVAIPDLLGNIIRPITIKDLSLENALANVLQGTGWDVGETDFQGITNITFEDHITALEAVYKLIEVYGAEIQYEVKFQNGEIVGKYVHVTERRGQVTNKLFVYGKDLTDVKQTVNTEGLITALIGLGPGDTGGTRLNLAGSTYASMPAGYESEYGADFIASEEALNEYGRSGRHKFGVFVSQNAKDVTALYAETLKELKRREKPLTTYEMAVLTLERISGYEADKVRVGDTINVDDTSLSPRLYLEARIIELKRSYTDPQADEVVLGDYKRIALSDYSTITNLQKKISQNEAKWNAGSFKVEIISSNGTVFKEGPFTTTLEARVYENGIDVTNTIAAAEFTWTRVSTDPAADNAWNNKYVSGAKTINITAADVSQRATFFCELAEFRQ